MLHYNIDINVNNYTNIQGEAESLITIKKLLTKDCVIPDFVGYITFDNLSKHSICFSSQNDLGIFIGISDNTGIHLSISDENKLNEVIDVWGDGMYISKGLFVPDFLAWEGIEEYITLGRLCDKINWITPNDLPEDGNYIL
ncbi:MAG: hypothetical protein IJ661_09200 [Lachnospiraceae bacterium]|nr:hypothetical protein [Lachnospiraceae bacterium]